MAMQLVDKLIRRTVKTTNYILTEIGKQRQVFRFHRSPRTRTSIPRVIIDSYLSQQYVLRVMGVEQRSAARDEKKKTRSCNATSQGTSLATRKMPLPEQDRDSCLPPILKGLYLLIFLHLSASMNRLALSNLLMKSCSKLQSLLYYKHK